mmetsp:Transcript_54070/g.167381  ORF Transcript_54070/g.167381 Transcript_54070/m.167381 type:complete len:276 (-) Transcript_54070:978-1805(-)
MPNARAGGTPGATPACKRENRLPTCTVQGTLQCQPLVQQAPPAQLLHASQLLQLPLCVEARRATERGRQVVPVHGAADAPAEEAPQVQPVALEGRARDVQRPCAAVLRQELAVPPPLEFEGQVVGRKVDEGVAERLLLPGIVGQVEEVVGAVGGPLLQEPLLAVARRDVAHGQGGHARPERPQGPVRAQGAARHLHRRRLLRRQLLRVLRKGRVLGCGAAVPRARRPAAESLQEGADNARRRVLFGQLNAVLRFVALVADRGSTVAPPCCTLLAV